MFCGPVYSLKNVKQDLTVFTCVILEADPETRIHFKQLSWEVTPENSVRGWVGCISFPLSLQTA